MEIIRTEEGRYSRKFTLKVDDSLAYTINEDIQFAMREVQARNFKPLTVEELWDIMTNSIQASRYKEEYLFKLRFSEGNMRLGDFVRYEINNIFSLMPGELENEEVEYYEDEYYN